jgi:hypothetical protein
MTISFRFWEHFKIEGDKVLFTIPEPKRLDDYRTKLFGHEWENDDYRAWRICKEHFDNFNSIEKPKREEILSTFRKGGITIGETAKMFNVNSDVVSDIIAFNIQDISVLREESI